MSYSTMMYNETMRSQYHACHSLLFFVHIVFLFTRCSWLPPAYDIAITMIRFFTSLLPNQLLKLQIVPLLCLLCYNIIIIYFRIHLFRVFFSGRILKKLSVHFGSRDLDVAHHRAADETVLDGHLRYTTPHHTIMTI